MKNIGLIIAYDGTSFLGWQKTSLGPSIEETLEEVLSRILQQKIRLQGASRTDSHVHAEGQSVSFLTDKNIPLPKLLHGINALLPPTVRALRIEEKELSFHPTLDSLGKEYHYFICNNPYQHPKHRLFSWHVYRPLTLSLMQEAAKELLGTHNFSAFCNQITLMNKNPICTLHSIQIEPVEELRFRFSIIGDRFLYKMMRNLIGTLVYVGQGKISLGKIKEILSEKKRILAGVTAPPHGLHLIRVFYKKEEKGILLSK